MEYTLHYDDVFSAQIPSLFLRRTKTLGNRLFRGNLALFSGNSRSFLNSFIRVETWIHLQDYSYNFWVAKGILMNRTWQPYTLGQYWAALITKLSNLLSKRQKKNCPVEFPFIKTVLKKIQKLRRLYGTGSRILPQSSTYSNYFCARTT